MAPGQNQKCHGAAASVAFFVGEKIRLSSQNHEPCHKLQALLIGGFQDVNASIK
jgi:hypothetical protein